MLHSLLVVAGDDEADELSSGRRKGKRDTHDFELAERATRTPRRRYTRDRFFVAVCNGPAYTMALNPAGGPQSISSITPETRNSETDLELWFRCSLTHLTLEISMIE
ncbi:hypothetical protein EYF80_004602 [Liparis tanakae]|uniref:Uncharacterized protein n=1 Tax=Liparis tanakae TaxID=230148 RepID=A0A4Z2J731_9TELE|nr:hypothetical protein EYF80_004602 [Liparis tanakae]